MTIAAALAASLVWQFVPLEGAEERLVDLPVRGAAFRSEGAPLSASELRLLGDALACRRVYQFRAQRVLVSIVDATHNRHAVHDPLYCFVGSGWQTVQQRRQAIQGGYAQVVGFEREGERTELAFWFSDGRRRHGSPLRYWLQTTLRRLTCGLSGPEPVLVIIQNFDEQPVDWDGVLASGSPFFSV